MDQQTEKTSRKPRADSQRNREKLLIAARVVFAAGGQGASLEAVARQAEVGIGTLYRHFPTREALFQAVYMREVDELTALADRLAAAEEPVAALRDWLHAAVRMVATKKGMVAALAPVLDKSCESMAENARRMRAAAGMLLQRGQAEGLLRPEITGDDLVRTLVAMCYAPGSQQETDWQPDVLRLLDIFVDGMRNRPGN